MSNWLKDAERRQRFKEKGSLRTSSKILEKKEKIKSNYEKNRNLYENFIFNLNNLSERTNSLPSKYRNDFGKIRYKSKESKLNTHLYFYSSTKRMRKRRFKSFRSFFKFSHQKNVRLVYFNVSKHIDKIDIEIKEVSMFREKLSRAKLEEGKKEELKTKSSKANNEDQEKSNFKLKFLFQYEMEKLDEDFAMEFIDWLAFKKDTEQLPIPPDHIKHQ